jgi:UDP-glucose 4-epimerase
MTPSPPEQPRDAARIVVLGAAGFVGSACVRFLGRSHSETLGLTRKEVDLLSGGAPEALAGHLRPGDTLVFISARAPCKDAAMFSDNMRMAEVVLEAVQKVATGHLVYVSSDAVYSDSAEPLSEASPTEPDSIHGRMHLARERLLQGGYAGPMAILRPTLIYGANDPHNGYGPNRFRRLASTGKDIVLFGNGEERRDHIHVDDVATVIGLVAQQRSTVTLNVATGEVASFKEVAELTAGQFSPRVRVTSSPRTGPMPHGGYRAFDVRALKDSFPAAGIAAWREGIVSVCREEMERVPS